MSSAFPLASTKSSEQLETPGSREAALKQAAKLAEQVIPNDPSFPFAPQAIADVVVIGFRGEGVLTIEEIHRNLREIRHRDAPSVGQIGELMELLVGNDLVVQARAKRAGQEAAYRLNYKNPAVQKAAELITERLSQVPQPVFQAPVAVAPPAPPHRETGKRARSIEDRLRSKLDRLSNLLPALFDSIDVADNELRFANRLFGDSPDSPEAIGVLSPKQRQDLVALYRGLQIDSVNRSAQSDADIAHILETISGLTTPGRGHSTDFTKVPEQERVVEWIKCRQNNVVDDMRLKLVGIRGLMRDLDSLEQHVLGAEQCVRSESWGRTYSFIEEMPTGTEVRDFQSNFGKLYSRCDHLRQWPEDLLKPLSLELKNLIVKYSGNTERIDNFLNRLDQQVSDRNARTLATCDRIEAHCQAVLGFFEWCVQNSKDLHMLIQFSADFYSTDRSKRKVAQDQLEAVVKAELWDMSGALKVWEERIWEVLNFLAPEIFPEHSHVALKSGLRSLALQEIILDPSKDRFTRLHNVVGDTAAAIMEISMLPGAVGAACERQVGIIRDHHYPLARQLRSLLDHSQSVRDCFLTCDELLRPYVREPEHQPHPVETAIRELLAETEKVRSRYQPARPNVH